MSLPPPEPVLLLLLGGSPDPELRGLSREPRGLARAHSVFLQTVTCVGSVLSRLCTRLAEMGNSGGLTSAAAGGRTRVSAEMSNLEAKATAWVGFLTSQEKACYLRSQEKAC